MKATKKRKKNKKCCVCGRPVFSIHSMYCLNCARIAMRMKIRRFSPEAEEAVWEYIRKYGYRCYYTKILLEMDDTKSPWFCVFDHLIPLDPNTIVLTSALVNEIKSALTEDEFWNIVLQLDDFKHKGKKIKKISVTHWRRHLPASQGKNVILKKRPIWPDPKDKKCSLCGKPVFSLHSKYCLSCSHFVYRLELKKFGAKVEKDILDQVRAQGYVCALTGLSLDMVDDRSPWYGVFNYLVPGDKTKVVLTCALFCEMKSDLTIEEFWYYIRQLANYRRYGTKIRKKKLRHWFRLTPL